MKPTALALLVALCGCSDKLPIQYELGQQITEAASKLRAIGYTNIRVDDKSGWVQMDCKDGGTLSFGPVINFGTLAPGEKKTFKISPPSDDAR